MSCIAYRKQHSGTSSELKHDALQLGFSLHVPRRWSQYNQAHGPNIDLFTDRMKIHQQHSPDPWVIDMLMQSYRP